MGHFRRESGENARERSIVRRFRDKSGKRSRNSPNNCENN